MRKTSVRRFIHAVLDVLPLLIIPIFALNILHKETEPISIEVQEKISVDFNQKVHPITSVYNVTTTLTCEISNNYELILNGTAETSDLWYLGYYNSTNVYTSLKKGHKYLAKNMAVYSYNNLALYFSDVYNYNILTPTSDYEITGFRLGWITGTTFNNYIEKCNLFDLTQMYGEGNEPTIQDFLNKWQNNIPYQYTESQKMLVNKPNPTTYNNTDIGSQFVYALYKPINDYFNFNNLFNMGAIYNWIELNLFSGTTPLPIFIIWNVIVYEFFIDLIFLMYSLFMFIIDWSTNMIDKFLYKSRS